MFFFRVWVFPSLRSSQYLSRPLLSVSPCIKTARNKIRIVGNGNGISSRIVIEINRCIYYPHFPLILLDFTVPGSSFLLCVTNPVPCSGSSTMPFILASKLLTKPSWPRMVTRLLGLGKALEVKVVRLVSTHSDSSLQVDEYWCSPTQV